MELISLPVQKKKKKRVNLEKINPTVVPNIVYLENVEKKKIINELVF